MGKEVKEEEDVSMVTEKSRWIYNLSEAGCRQVIPATPRKEARGRIEFRASLVNKVRPHSKCKTRSC
jgi:hypothetical protein